MEISPAAMRAFAALLHDRTGQELGAGRSWRIETALSPLLRAHGLDSLDRLACVMTRDPALAAGVVDALLNNETSFFRDRAAFVTLLKGALEPIAAARAGSRRLSIWCAGCSTGQEVYSIAMLLGGEPERWAGWTIDLLGSDVSTAAIARARSGIYSHFEVQRGLPVGEMLRWFEPVDDEWRVRPELRTRVRFVTHNLLERQLAIKADAILCRNVLLYLAAAKRAQVFDRLGAALAPDGVLMLGAGETVLGQSQAFSPDQALRGLYRRADWKAAPVVPAAVERRAAG